MNTDDIRMYIFETEKGIRYEEILCLNNRTFEYQAI